MAVARLPRSAVVRPLPKRAEPRTRHLRVVPEARRRLGLRLSPRAGVVLTLVLFAALFGVAVSHALLIEGQARLDRLDTQAAAEQARYERLRLDVAELESPDRIVREAQDQLGMVPADDVTWLTPDPAAADAAAADGSTTTDEPDGAEAGAGTGSEAAAGADRGGVDDPGTPDTSWADVKPYLEPAP